ncbi:hypothetical protein CLOM_g4520 [Closterium sp. NIES-68]|nr:hypothetical protein CLOM_g4520 [Closterium sp. NIES-68]
MTTLASVQILLLVASASGSLLTVAASTSSGLPDGATCYYDKSYTPIKPFCKRDFGCLVTKVISNSPHFMFKGKCASDVPLDQITKQYCMFRSVIGIKQNQCELSRFVNDTYIGNCINTAPLLLH